MYRLATVAQAAFPKKNLFQLSHPRTVHSFTSLSVLFLAVDSYYSNSGMKTNTLVLGFNLLF